MNQLQWVIGAGSARDRSSFYLELILSKTAAVIL